MSDVFLDWFNKANISLELFEEETEKWWDRLNPIQRYNIFPYATGENWGSLREMITCDEYRCKFEELDDDIKEEIVEKYTVQKGLVKVPENSDLPDWLYVPLNEYEKRILEI